MGWHTMASATAKAGTCGTCSRYIADWLDDKLHTKFEAKQRRRLHAEFQPTATKEITRLLMRYLRDEKDYEAVRNKMQNFVQFVGLDSTIHIFSSGLPAVADTVEFIDMALFDATGKGWDKARDWIRRMVFELFMDLLELHRVHEGRAPFRDIWRAALRAPPAPPDNRAVCGPPYEQELQVIKVHPAANFLESYLTATPEEKKEWDELYA
jgi:hypothetical protein